MNSAVAVTSFHKQEKIHLKLPLEDVLYEKKRKAGLHDMHIKKIQNTKVFPLYVEQLNNAQKEKRNRVPKSQWADRIKRSEYTSPTTPLQHSVYE